jgi:hypothetical protein
MDQIFEDTRAGDWMQTYTGEQFWPLDPRLNEIDIRDIAHALAYSCRYNGHCLHYYSVAEHCVHVSHAVPVEHALAGLLHDAAEAYIADVPRPLKPYLTNYREIESRLEAFIAVKFNVHHPWHGSVHEADTRILADEQKSVMCAPPADWRLPLPPLGIYLPCWEPKDAERFFLERFWQLTGGPDATH